MPEANEQEGEAAMEHMEAVRRLIIHDLPLWMGTVGVFCR